MIRVTKPEKWKDTFFLNINPYDKLLFIYFYENCDDAGFIDLNFKKIIDETGISKDDVAIGIKNLERTFIPSGDCTKIWIKKFLLHQNRLPLDLKTPEGNYIKLQLENNASRFNYAPDFDVIIKNVKKAKKTKLPSTFIKPTVDEIVEKFKVSDWSFISKEEILQLFDYYESVGWKVGSKKMVDWNKAFINCFKRNHHSRQNNQTQKNQTQTKLGAIIEGNKQLQNFDFNTLK